MQSIFMPLGNGYAQKRRVLRRRSQRNAVQDLGRLPDDDFRGQDDITVFHGLSVQHPDQGFGGELRLFLKALAHRRQLRVEQAGLNDVVEPGDPDIPRNGDMMVDQEADGFDGTVIAEEEQRVVFFHAFDIILVLSCPELLRICQSNQVLLGNGQAGILHRFFEAQISGFVRPHVTRIIRGKRIDLAVPASDQVLRHIITPTEIVEADIDNRFRRRTVQIDRHQRLIRHLAELRAVPLAEGDGEDAIHVPRLDQPEDTFDAGRGVEHHIVSGFVDLLFDRTDYGPVKRVRLHRRVEMLCAEGHHADDFRVALGKDAQPHRRNVAVFPEQLFDSFNDRL